MPHIKTYARVYEGGDIAWLLLTSANMSKPAWGAWVKGDGTFGAQSFELGVLMVSGEGGLGQLRSVGTGGGMMVPLPFEVERVEVSARDNGVGDDGGDDHDDGNHDAERALRQCDTVQAYGPGDEPWTWDVDHLVPDVLGQRWRVGQ